MCTFKIMVYTYNSWHARCMIMYTCKIIMYTCTVFVYKCKVIIYTCQVIVCTCISKYVYVQDNYVYMQEKYVYTSTKYFYTLQNIFMPVKKYVKMFLQGHRVFPFQHVKMSHVEVLVMELLLTLRISNVSVSAFRKLSHLSNEFVQIIHTLSWVMRVIEHTWGRRTPTR